MEGGSDDPTTKDMVTQMAKEAQESFRKAGTEMKDPHISEEDLRAKITKLVTDMTVEKSLSEEFLIDALLALLDNHKDEVEREMATKVAKVLVAKLGEDAATLILKALKEPHD